MSLGMRDGLTLLVLELRKAAMDDEDLLGSSRRNPSTLLESPTLKPAGSTPQVPFSRESESSKSTGKPRPIPVCSVTVITSNATTKPSTPPVSSLSKKVTVTTLKPTAASKITPPGVSTNMTPTTLKSTLKITSVSQNTSQMSTSSVTTAHDSLMTSISSSVTITATINSKENKGSKFDIGSFVGGIALTLGILSVLCIGCKMYYSRRGIQYRTIDDHDAII